jgi:5'-deoxynucleotidase YfbR-like HD superfamily hydrolase
VAEGRIIDLEKYRTSRSWGHSKIYVTEEAAEDEADARNLSPDEAMDAFMEYMKETDA